MSPARSNVDTSRAQRWRERRIYTLGHSTRSLDELVQLLRAFGVSLLVDIRSIPRSRRNPQFNRESLPESLASHQLGYVHLAELGGLRKTHGDSPNKAWRNLSFRGYADHMLSEEFERGLAKLLEFGGEHTLALMCAEAVPWRCHRSLVGDALTARGATVAEIASLTRATPHRLTSFAKVEGPRVTYPSDDDQDVPLPTRGPFHLEATVRVLQRRPSALVDVWEGDRYLRVLEGDGELALLEVRNRGTLSAPDLRYAVRAGSASSTAHASFAQTLRKLLGLDADPRSLAKLSRSAPALRPTTAALRGMRPPRFPNLLETFVNVVPFQQVSLESGVANVGRLVARFGRQLDHDGRTYHAFPTTSAIAGARIDALRKCGLSMQKAHTLRTLARAIASGELSEHGLEHASSQDALRTLTKLPGIGPWSAGLVLLRGLGRLDVFPSGDVGAARGLRRLMPLDAADAHARLISDLGSRRGLLYFCSLGGSLLSKGLIHAAPVSRAARAQPPD